LRTATNQTEITVAGFGATLFLAPVPMALANSSPVPHAPEVGHYVNLRPVDQQEVQALFCSTPVPLRGLEFDIPLTAYPNIHLEISFQDIGGGKCKMDAALDRHFGSEGGADNRVLTTPMDNIYVYKNGDRAALQIFVSSADLHKIEVNSPIRLSDFGSTSTAEIVAEDSAGGPPQFPLVEPYLERFHPSIVGISISGDGAEGDDFIRTWQFTRIRLVKFDPQTGGFNGFYLQNPRTVLHWNPTHFLGFPG
jgi:hypothetical protein